MRTTAGGIDVDEQPGFVIEGARVALGPLRMDLVATYQRWENDLEVANAATIPLRRFRAVELRVRSSLRTQGHTSQALPSSAGTAGRKRDGRVSSAEPGDCQTVT